MALNLPSIALAACLLGAPQGLPEAGAESGDSDEGEPQISPGEISVRPEDGWTEKGKEVDFVVYGREGRADTVRLRAAGALEAPVPLLADHLADPEAFVRSWNFVDASAAAERGDGWSVLEALMRSPLLSPRCARMKVEDDSSRVADFGGQRLVWASAAKKPGANGKSLPADTVCVSMTAFSGAVTLLPADEGRKTLAVVDLLVVPGGHLPRYISGKSARWWLTGILGTIRRSESAALEELAAMAAAETSDAGMDEDAGETFSDAASETPDAGRDAQTPADAAAVQPSNGPGEEDAGPVDDDAGAPVSSEDAAEEADEDEADAGQVPTNAAAPDEAADGGADAAVSEEADAGTAEDGADDADAKAAETGA